eukprot:7198480-Prymnesium_polylepis.2
MRPAPICAKRLAIRSRAAAQRGGGGPQTQNKRRFTPCRRHARRCHRAAGDGLGGPTIADASTFVGERLPRASTTAQSEH